MNIDPSKQAQEQEEQNQQTKTAVEATVAATTAEPATTTTITSSSSSATTTTTSAVLALLISPSSPSSVSTVSPTASSISKNSSTDEVDETTAEAEPPHPEAVCQCEAVAASAAHRRQDDEQLKTVLQLEIKQRANEDVHQNNSPVQQHGNRSPAESPGAGSNATMTLEATDVLAHCVPENVTTELRTPDTHGEPEVAATATPAYEEHSRRRKCDSLEGGLTAEALSPKTPQSLSSSSSSSTSSTPSVGEERRLPVVPEEDSIVADSTPVDEERCFRRTLASNNNPALEVDLISADSGGGASSGCINDRYNNNNNNNNSKDSDSDFQLVGDSSTHTKASERNGDGDNETPTSLSSPGGRAVVVTGLVLEEGVLTSAVAPATEIALGQGEQQRCATGDDKCTATQLAISDEHLRSVVSQPPLVLGEAKGAGAVAKTNDDNNSELSVAPIEIVQTLPNEQTTTVKRQGDLITTAGMTVAVDQKNGNEENGVTSRSEENKTCASASGATETVAESSPSSSLSSCSSTTAPSLSPPSSSAVSSSASSSSSTESSPEVLAGSQQEPSGKGADDETLLVRDNRPLCDGSPKGHSLEGEGFPAAAHHQTQPIPPCPTALAGVAVPQSCNETEGTNSSNIGRRHTQVTTGTRLLTLAEELSQASAAAASLLYAGSVTPSLAVSAKPPSAVVDVLPKSAAGTAAAVVSGSSRSTSPVLHSSLKKPSKMVVTTGAGTVAAAAVASTAKGEHRRRVSFPKDAQLITGYLDPVNPWACISICETPELLEQYRSSCRRHNTMPLKSVLDHLQSIDVTKGRVPLLSLKDQHLSYSGCEALEEIFKHVQYRCIDLSHSGLDDVTASVMFDIIEYYEAATELDISDNLQMSSKSWTACINMIKKSQALNVLITRGPTISDYQANNLAKALNASAIHTLKLEHCVLSQQPIASLCTILKRNTVLRELWLAHNQLSCEDAQQIANLLRSNFYIQLIDISNNRIGDKGVEHIVSAIVEQAVYFKDVQEKKRKSDLTFSDLSSSLNSINNSVKNYFPHRLRSSDSESISTGADAHVDASSLPLTLTPPVTPPSTPALPSCDTSTEEKKKKKKKVVEQSQASVKLEATNGTTFAVEAASVYTMQQHDNDETNPPLLPPSPLTPPTLGAVAPSNVELVEMSTKHSVSLQTTSDKEKLDMVVAPPVMMTAEEEALMNSSSGEATATGMVEHELGDGGGESKTMSTSAETVQTDSKESTVVREEVQGGEEFAVSLDTHSDSPVPQAPKKPRLAKQDSVLTEFEASISSAMETGGDSELTEEKLKNKQSGTHLPEGVTIPEPLVTEEQLRTTSVMEEDVLELCTDYDDDGSNLRISEENLFVELGIPALSEQECLDSANVAPDSPGDVFAPLDPPSKKDELQLLIEKTKQKDKKQPIETVEEAELSGQASEQRNPTPPATQKLENRERKSAISSDERSATVPAVTKKDRTQSSSSDSYVAVKGIQMVNVEIKDNLSLSRSLDSVGGESESDFESSSPFRTTAPSAFPNERSFSSESLNSETSIDSNDSKSSLKIHESKFAAKNGTLERQQSNVNRDTVGAEPTATNPCGLQVLVLWNNEITRSSARHFQRLLEKTSTLDTLNVGSNQLCNSFVSGISGSLKSNTTLTNLGLQGAHLSDKGVKTMAEIIEFGGNSSLQRIDLRHNNIQKGGLEALNEAMKSNKSVTRIDLDDTPRRIKDTSLDGVGSEYSRLVNNIRAQCERNKNPPEPSEPISTTVRRARANYLSSRKISLTCPSIKTSPSAIADKQHLLDPNGGCKKSTGGRLRSPLPSPIPSPIASPVPSPSRNRFHVSRVTDSGGGGGGSASSPSPSSTGSSPTLFFPSNSRFRVVTVAEPDSASAKSANNPYRSSSTISLPMSKSSTSSFAMGTSCAGTMMAPLATVNRRPVCSSAPTLSSFPPSPLSPLAAGGPVVGRMGVASQTPSPLLPPSYSTGSNNNNTFQTTMLPSPLLTTGVIAGSSPTMPGLVPIANTTMPLGIPQTLLQQQHHQHLHHQQHQQQPTQHQYQPQPQFVPMMPPQQQQQQPNYHFITTFGPGNSTSIPLQPMITQIQKIPNLIEPLATLPPQQILQQMVHHHPQQQQQILPQTPSSYTGKVRQHSSESPHQHQNSSSNNSSTTLHDSVLSSTSIESPDLEVKRFMSGGALRDDSCCSSISSNSIESIDNPNFNINTSMSSTDESFDLIVNSPPPVTTSGGYAGAIASTVVHLPPTAGSGSRKGSAESSPSVSSMSRVPEEESTLIPRASIPIGSMQSGEPAKLTVDAPASFSSSSMVLVNLASSQESLYDVHDLSGSSNSSSISAAATAAAAAAASNLVPTVKPPITAPLVPTTCSGASVIPTTNITGSAPGAALAMGGNNSNESTLTSVQNLEREPTVTKVAPEKAPRVRKTSWILGGSGSSSHKHTDSSSSGGSTPTPGGGSGYPPAIEKLLSIFHPSNLFSSSKTSASVSSASPPPNAQDGSSASSHGSGSQPPSRKESPMGGLFYWAHHGAGSGSSSNTSANTSPTSAAKKDDERAVLKVNVSPETTLTPQQLQPLQNQAQVMTQLQSTSSHHQHHHHHHHQHQQHSAEHMPPQLKVEMKENISPENTITNKLLLSSNAPPAVDASTVLLTSNPPTSCVAGAPIVNVASAATAHAKVIFQLGGDYDESEDDIDTLTSKYGNHPSLGGGMHQSGPSSLLGGSTTSNSSGISIGSGTSAGDMMSGSGGLMVSPSPSATSGQSATSDTVVVYSHLGQIARDSLSMFKNPSLTSQDSISIRSMDSLTEIGTDGGAGTASKPTSTLRYEGSTAGRKDATQAATAMAAPSQPTSTTFSSSTSTPLATQMSPSASEPLADRPYEAR